MVKASRHFLDLSDFDRPTLENILGAARAMKSARAGQPKGVRDQGEPLKGRVLP